MQGSAPSELTMSSLEIAEFTGKPHNDLLKSIRKMEHAWSEATGGNFSRSEYTDSTGRKLPVFVLTQRECLYVTAKFNDRVRARLVARWEQLERKSAPSYGESVFFDTNEPFYHYRTFLRDRQMSLTSGSYWRRMQRYPNEFRTDGAGEHYLSGSLARLIHKQGGVRAERRAIKERNPKYLPSAKKGNGQMSLFSEEQLTSILVDVCRIEDLGLRMSIADKLTEGLRDETR